MGMKPTWLAVLALASSGCERIASGEQTGFEQHWNSALDTAEASPAPGAVAVIELFTSEGCSSCPAADKVLNDWAAATAKTGARVFPIALHVDYWNSANWSDRFSREAFSDRQQAYAHRMNLHGLYTPQAVIDGVTQLTGSDEAGLGKAVDSALRVASSTTLALATSTAGDQTRVTWTVHGAPAGAVVDVAIVESGLVSHVEGGENLGRDLRHDNVVRTLVTRPVEEGTVSLAIPTDVVRTHAGVVAWVQGSGGVGRIVAASKVPLG